ncbi:ephrin-A3-like isoform 1-T1 [Anomaloglossus baeobatrachus]|uniref:ephrin-A3-like isoform X1 n=1 Tax=Anomaloglossus baeobatrachus TaxID=238106 RepID=UPI003F4F7472
MRTAGSQDVSDERALPCTSAYCRLRRNDYTVQVNVNDYLDIYCPHYNDTMADHRMEQYILYMVNYEGYHSCNTSHGFKRWECNRPHSPHSPIKFSEKFQRYSAFSLGYEFHAGHNYYYISTPTHNHRHSCLKMKVSVCCATTAHSGEKHAPTLPQFTIGPEVKIEDLGQSAHQGCGVGVVESELILMESEPESELILMEPESQLILMESESV